MSDQKCIILSVLTHPEKHFLTERASISKAAVYSQRHFFFQKKKKLYCVLVLCWWVCLSGVAFLCVCVRLTAVWVTLMREIPSALFHCFPADYHHFIISTLTRFLPLSSSFIHSIFASINSGLFHSFLFSYSFVSPSVCPSLRLSVPLHSVILSRPL